MLKKLADRFFEWYCHPEYYEDIKGDLEELYENQIEKSSKRKANWLFAWEVLLLFRPAIIRPFQFLDILYLVGMIKNYFKIGFRNLYKYKGYSFVHILGLAIGLSAFLLINQYTSYEKSYDRFHDMPDQLYRLTTDNVINGKIKVRDAMSFAPSGKVLEEELPGILGSTTTFKRSRLIFKKDDLPVEENNVIAVDSNFLNLFNYTLLEGDKERLLEAPYTMVLTKSKARKYFGESQPIGQTIELLGNFNRPFKVVGIMEDIPQNTHYKFDILLSLNSFQERIQRDAWNGFNYYTYLLLDENANLEQIRAQLPALSKKYLNEESTLVFNLQPVKDIHLHSDFTYEPEIHGSATAVGFLDIISLFILFIAWVNYVNLSTARAMERAKEVGLRKVVGARKAQLIGQFFIESLLINFLGAVIAVGLSQLALPYFNELVGKTVMTEIWADPEFFTKLGIFFLVGTLVTGIYPAFVLSSFRPIGVLKGSFSRTNQGIWLRKGLVVFQFAASFILIAATATVYQQIRYMVNKDMGIDTEQVIGFANPESDLPEEQFDAKYKSFTEQLLRQNGVSEIGSISALPGGGSSDIGSSSGGIQVVGKTELINATIYRNNIDDKIQKTLDISLVAGRNFNKDFIEDTSAVIINMAMLELLNISDPEEVIGEYLKMGRSEDADKLPIIGVFADYNRSTLKNNVEPTLFMHNERTRSTVVKLSGTELGRTLNKVEQVWGQFFPNSPFNYAFLDERFSKLYKEDKKFGFIFANFSLLAIFVALLGLFGLSSYLSIQRTKEVSIRKVLGASIQNIILLFFRDFLWLIIIAVGVGLPLVYFSMNKWLNGYAYRIDFPWWVLGLSVFLLILLAFFTVSYQTYKIAILNPAKTIRHE